MLCWICPAFCSVVSSSGISRRMSAFLFRSRGEQDVTKSFLVRQALKGFRRGTLPRDVRRSVSFEELLALGERLATACWSVFECTLFRLAFSLAFFGAFRISELVSPSRKREGGLRPVDVWDRGSHLVCFIPRSKTDQLGKGLWVTLPGSVMYRYDVTGNTWRSGHRGLLLY